MKKLILFYVFLLAGMQVQAQEQEQTLKVWMSNPTMVADGTTTTYLTVYQTDINADGTHNLYAQFEMRLNVPEGITVATKRVGRKDVNDITLNEERFDGISISEPSIAKTPGLISISTLNTGTESYYPDSESGETIEELFTIGLKADPSMTNGTYEIFLSDVKFIRLDASAETPNETVKATMTVTGGQASEGEICYTLSDAGVGTLILPYDAELPNGLNAYRCVSLQETTLVLEEQANIAAHTPVLLQGAPGTYTFTGTPTEGEDSYTSGLLTGVMEATAITTGYVLQTQDGVTGFYAVDSGRPITVPGGRCYLQMEAGVKMLDILFPEDATGINCFSNSPLKRADTYNVAGQIVNGKCLRGIYIRDGKKMIVVQ